MNFDKLKELALTKFGGFPLWMIVAVLGALYYFFGRKKAYVRRRPAFRRYAQRARYYVRRAARPVRQFTSSAYSRTRTRAQAWRRPIAPRRSYQRR